MSLVVIGGSAGGIRALIDIVQRLPSDLPASVAVVIHTSSRAPAVLPAILARSATMPVSYVTEVQALEPGRILLAPPDRHLVISGTDVGLGDGARENSHRPSIDVLFRSAAVSLGPQVVGVVLSGVLDDGAAGLQAVVAQGGRAVVQDPDDAEYAAMPTNALRRVPDAVVAPADELGAAIIELAAAPPGRVDLDAMSQLEVESAFSQVDRLTRSGPPRPPGQPSTFACPDCHGVLWAVEEGQAHRYRCRTGHAWSAESLASTQDTAVESALYTAVRVLEERAELADHMRDQAVQDGRPRTAEQFAARAEQARAQAASVRTLLPGPAPVIAAHGEDAHDEHARDEGAHGADIEAP